MFSIDPEGMENTCTTNAFSRIVRTSAAITMTVRSRQNARFRLVVPFASSPGAAESASSSDGRLVVWRLVVR